MQINCRVTLLPMKCTNKKCTHEESISIINQKHPDGKVVCSKCGFKTLDILRYNIFSSSISLIK